MMQKKSKKHLWLGKAIVIIILLGTLMWSVVMVKSGYIYDYGMGFWGPNGHDGIWHISLSRSLLTDNLNLLIFRDARITNYHVGFDVLLALLHVATNLSFFDLYFRVLPPLFGLIIGALTVKLLLVNGTSKLAIAWSLFFIYFSGNIGWLVTFLRGGVISGESMFWAQPSVLTLINPPYALSLIFVLTGLILMNMKVPAKILLASLFFGLLIQIKAYAAVLTLMALVIVGIYEYMRFGKVTYIVTAVLSILIALAVFLPFNKDSASLLEIKPLWFLQTMMLYSDRVGWPRLGEAMINYQLAGNYIKLTGSYILAFLIFWYGNLGTRFIAEFYLVRIIRRKSISLFELFVFVIIIGGLVLPLIFVQKGTAWNTIQFFYYSLFFISLLAGIVFSKIISLQSTSTKKILLICLMLFFTLPVNIAVLTHYLPNRPPAKVSNEELEALSHMKSLPDGLVVVMPFEREIANRYIQNPPRPLYAYESTAYVSAFTGKQVFLEDSVNLDILDADWETRNAQLLEFVYKMDENKRSEFLKENKANYVYLTPPHTSMLISDTEVVFNNNEITILKVVDNK